MQNAKASRRVFTWHVEFRLVDDIPMEVPNGVAVIGRSSYATIGADGTGRVSVYRVERERELRPAAAVIDSARRSIDALLALIQFRSRLPSVVNDVVATLHEETGEAIGGALQDATLVATAVVASHFTAPTTEELESDDRLHTWLTLWNLAHSSESGIESIRNCYMICEDMDLDEDTELRELRFTRNFVSHAVVNNEELLKFLARNLGRRVDRFIPNDDRHAAFIRERRVAAESITANLIEARIAGGR